MTSNEIENEILALQDDIRELNDRVDILLAMMLEQQQHLCVLSAHTTMRLPVQTTSTLS